MAVEVPKGVALKWKPHVKWSQRLKPAVCTSSVIFAATANCLEWQAMRFVCVSLPRRGLQLFDLQQRPPEIQEQRLVATARFGGPKGSCRTKYTGFPPEFCRDMANPFRHHVSKWKQRDTSQVFEDLAGAIGSHLKDCSRPPPPRAPKLMCLMNE